MKLIVGNPINSLTFSGIASEAAMRPRFRIVREWFATATGIQMDVATERPIVTGVFDEERFVPTLIEMPSASVSLGIPIGVAREPVLHPSSQVGLGSLDESMDMIGHPAIGQYHPTAPLHLIPKPLRKSFVMTCIIEQFSSSVPTGNDMVVCACKLNARRSRHQISNQE